jgi:hypothetical protein
LVSGVILGIEIISANLYIHNIKARMPFQYGIAKMTAMPHLFLILDCMIDGKPQQGAAADSLVPKWFSKDPQTSYQEDIKDMLSVIQAACKFTVDLNTTETVFELWQSVYASQEIWGSQHGYPALLWNFGVSLVERAVIDAFCRANQETLFQVLQSNKLGIKLGDIHPRLGGLLPSDLLPENPLQQIIVRHTVGLSDPLFDEEIPLSERFDDGLPQSLQANIDAYGLSHFKIKVQGDTRKDLERLEQISGLLNELPEYYFTLDGNEQFKFIDDFKEFWQAVQNTPSLTSFFEHMLFVEQPLQRQMALCPENQTPLREWSDRPPMIIDESDSKINSLETALDCGYNGTSHKNCKGIFKSIANACLLEYLHRQEPNKHYILSGEDLINVGPVALLQDLAMDAVLGIHHVERNGHQYFEGLSIFPQEIQKRIHNSHPDLYNQNQTGLITLNIKNGKISIESVLEAPFGTMLPPEELQDFPILENWNYKTLGLS